MSDGLPAGKLPNELLASLLARLSHGDPRVLLGPAVGRDAAVIDAGGPRLLVAKADPVTFATDQIGWYAVHVNANDIACMGATPAWFLATVLLPEASPPALAEAILEQIRTACESLSVELVGGHTEVTYRLDRPIVSGAMLGEVEAERLVRPERARPGDALLLTKAIAIEGTAVLAREAPDRLGAAGITNGVIERAAEFITEPGISVVPEVRAACAVSLPHAMHDPTEGGIATALYELSAACDTGVEVKRSAIPVTPETLAVCGALSLDPLGLLASGSLLLVCAADEAGEVIQSIEETGVPARQIGSLTAPEDGVIMLVNGERTAVPRFERDEVARFLSEQAG